MGGLHRGVRQRVTHTQTVDISQVCQSAATTHQFKEACHVPPGLCRRWIMKVSPLCLCTEKPLCDVLFDILAERRE